MVTYTAKQFRPRVHVTSVRDALSSPVLWLAFVAFTGTAGVLIWHHLHTLPDSIVVGSLLASAVAFTVLVQSANRDRVMERIEEARADLEARLYVAQANIAEQLRTLNDYLGSGSMAREFSNVNLRIDACAKEINALGYQTQAIPGAITTVIDGERTAAHLAAMAQEAKEEGAAPTGVIIRPVEWRQRRPGA